MDGWKTYLVFGSTLILAIAASFGWADLTDAHKTVIDQIVEFLNDPIVLSAIGLVMRKVTKGPAAV